MKDLVKKLADELTLNVVHAQNAINLLFEEDCTIPFVARYRKEITGSMDEVKLRDLRDRYHYMMELESIKARYLKVVEEHCKNKPELVEKLPDLRLRFQACKTKQELEDLYLPFKPKRRTRAQVAKEKGLEPLLNSILDQRASLVDLLGLAKDYITPEEKKSGENALDEKLHVNSPEEALTGAGDILAEKIHENATYRSYVRKVSNETGVIASKKIEVPSTNTAAIDIKKKKTNPSKYENYFDYREPIHSAASHRIMAVRRGESEKVLKLNIEVDNELIVSELTTKIFEDQETTKEIREWITSITHDAYRRLIAPSIETEIRLQLKNRAEEEAIKVFSTNLENLLLLPPIPGKIVMGIDPGLRTGSKLAVVSETGKLLDHNTVYPIPNKMDADKSIDALKTILELIQKHNVGFVAIGNGTGSREIDQLVIKLIKEHKLNVKRLVVNEAGASVYSTDDIAREEFPELDPTIRSAISIARRLQDPLAELVKVDPRSIGVGQYQHDCNVTKLNTSLKETVESCVNRVGVNVNTASYKLLSYVSGIGNALARNIINFRDQNGAFSSRTTIKDVSGFGPKAFEQAAGFLRVINSENPLDNSSVHPESYPIVEKIATDLQMPVSDLVGKKETIDTISLEKYVDESIGMPTLLDISSELLKPGRDPREDGSRLTFSENVATIEDLKIGMKLKGTVSNVTNFGAFVDIGVHQDGLVHISELSATFVKDPANVVSVGDVLDVYVLDVDVNRKRISLSCKQPSQNNTQQTQTRPRREQTNGNRTSNHQRASANRAPRQGDRRPPKRPNKGPARSPKHFSMDDLLNKFNSNS
ncbi:MAG: Tex family protein [Oligoflexales bacterium]